MCEETLSEFIEELSKREEPVPRDLIEKYARMGLPASEMAAATMAQAALRGPDVPASAFENSARKVYELAERTARQRARSASQTRPSLGARIVGALRRILHLES